MRILAPAILIALSAAALASDRQPSSNLRAVAHPELARELARKVDSYLAQGITCGVTSIKEVPVTECGDLQAWRVALSFTGSTVASEEWLVLRNQSLWHDVRLTYRRSALSAPEVGELQKITTHAQKLEHLIRSQCVFVLEQTAVRAGFMGGPDEVRRTTKASWLDGWPHEFVCRDKRVQFPGDGRVLIDGTALNSVDLSRDGCH